VSHRFRYAAFVLVVLSAAKASAQAAPQPPDAQALRSAIDDLKKDFEARLSALEMRLAAIEGGQQPPPAQPLPPPPAPIQPPAAADLSAPPPQANAAGAGASKVFNPDMAVIGDFLGTAGRVHTDPANNITPNPAFEMHE